MRSVRLDEVALDVVARDAHGVLEIAAARFARARGLAAGPAARALLRREEAGSTALGAGVAVPHARVGGIGAPWVIYLRLADPLPFKAPDGAPVREYLVIFVPERGDTDDHLALLATVATCFSDPAVRSALARASTAEDVRRAFGDVSPQQCARPA
ncbi:MAG: PTS sugar transporter subunit IIA [Burkholderiales bacterium]